MDKTLIGACGIYCRACDHYFANTEDGGHLLEDAKIKKRVAEHPCKGCKAEEEDKICIYCVGCDVRLCSLDKGVDICTECEQYPCGKLTRFQTGLAHHMEASKAQSDNRELNVQEWALLAEKRWTCPSCGKKYSYYEQICQNCGVPVDGLSPDLR